MYGEKDDYDNEIADYDAAIRLNPDYAEAFNNRGIAYDNKGDYDKAIADFDAVIRLKPDFAGAFHNRGSAYKNKGDYDKAIADFGKAIRLNPDYAEAFNNRGVAYLAKKAYDKAIADFGEAIRLKPDYAEVFNRGIAYYFTGDYGKAITDFTEAIRLNPDYAEAFNNRGGAYEKKDEHDKAIADFDKAIADFDATIRLKPDDAGAFNNRGIAYEKKGDYSKAIADFDAAIRLKPDYAKAFHNRGVAYIGLEKYTKAFEDYLTAVEKGFSGTGDAIIDAVFKNQPDLLWSADFKRLDAAPHYFLRLIAFCIKQRRTTKEYQNLITAVYSLWNALRCKQNDTGHIYQYTSLRVLENERVTRRFRLTPAGYQNDPEEGKVFYDRLKTFCKTDAISTVLDSIKSNSETVAFIRSFTALEDTLFMWDSSYAAHGEGAAVGIAKQKINKGFGIDSLSREMSLPAQSLEMPLNTLAKGKTDNPQTDAVKDVSKNYDVVPMQEKTEQPKESAAEGESKKPVSVPMSSIGLYKVLYIGETAEGENASAQAVLAKLGETAKALKALENEVPKDAAEKEQFIDFLSKLFTPVAHLIKKETYKHEEEYRLLYVSSIENALAENYLQTDTTSDDVSTGIYVETGEILFKDSTEKDIVYFGPKVSETTRLRYEHAFRHKGLADNVDLKPSNIHYW